MSNLNDDSTKESTRKSDQNKISRDAFPDKLKSILCKFNDKSMESFVKGCKNKLSNPNFVDMMNLLPLTRCKEAKSIDSKYVFKTIEFIKKFEKNLSPQSMINHFSIYPEVAKIKNEFQILKFSLNFQKIKKQEYLVCSEIRIDILSDIKGIIKINQEENKCESCMYNRQPPKVEEEKIEKTLSLKKIDDNKYKNSLNPDMKVNIEMKLDLDRKIPNNAYSKIETNLIQFKSDDIVNINKENQISNMNKTINNQAPLNSFAIPNNINVPIHTVNNNQIINNKHNLPPAFTNHIDSGLWNQDNSLQYNTRDRENVQMDTTECINLNNLDDEKRYYNFNGQKNIKYIY